MSDTQTSGLMSPKIASTTAFLRLGLMTCSAARRPMNTHAHQFFCFTRTDVSSEQMTGLASTTFSIAAVAASSGSRARARILLIAPSLIDRPKTVSYTHLRAHETRHDL